MNHVLIFKTNIESEEQYQQAGVLLESNNAILKWNIDREDIDNVLRIESTNPHINVVIQMMIDGGFICEELID